MNRKRIEKILHNCSKTIDESVNMVGAYNEIVKYIEDLEQQVEKQKEVIDKAVNDIQEIIDAVNKNTIIAMKQFNFKLEIIQDELSGSNDILKEVE